VASWGKREETNEHRGELLQLTIAAIKTS